MSPPTDERTLSLSDEQIRLLERFSPEFRKRHIEVAHTGALVAVDTFFVGVLKASARSTCRPPSTNFASRLGQALSQQAAGDAVQLMNNDVLVS